MSDSSVDDNQDQNGVKRKLSISETVREYEESKHIWQHKHRKSKHKKRKRTEEERYCASNSSEPGTKTQNVSIYQNAPKCTADDEPNNKNFDLVLSRVQDMNGDARKVITKAKRKCHTLNKDPDDTSPIVVYTNGYYSESDNDEGMDQDLGSLFNETTTKCTVLPQEIIKRHILSNHIDESVKEITSKPIQHSQVMKMIEETTSEQMKRSRKKECIHKLLQKEDLVVDKNKQKEQRKDGISSKQSSVLWDSKHSKHEILDGSCRKHHRNDVTLHDSDSPQGYEESRSNRKEAKWHRRSTSSARTSSPDSIKKEGRKTKVSDIPSKEHSSSRSSSSSYQFHHRYQRELDAPSCDTKYKRKRVEAASSSDRKRHRSMSHSSNDSAREGSAIWTRDNNDRHANNRSKMEVEKDRGSRHLGKRKPTDVRFISNGSSIRKSSSKTTNLNETRDMKTSSRSRDIKMVDTSVISRERRDYDETERMKSRKSSYSKTTDEKVKHHDAIYRRRSEGSERLANGKSIHNVSLHSSNYQTDAKAEVRSIHDSSGFNALNRKDFPRKYSRFSHSIDTSSQELLPASKRRATLSDADISRCGTSERLYYMSPDRPGKISIQYNKYNGKILTDESTEVIVVGSSNLKRYLPSQIPYRWAITSIPGINLEQLQQVLKNNRTPLTNVKHIVLATGINDRDNSHPCIVECLEEAKKLLPNGKVHYQSSAINRTSLSIKQVNTLLWINQTANDLLGNNYIPPPLHVETTRDGVHYLETTLRAIIENMIEHINANYA